MNNTPEDWVPEFPGQRPPFGPGNKARVTHGADSAEIVDPLATAAIEWLLSLPGSEYLREPLYWPAIEGWGHARARVVLLRRYCAGKDIEGALTEITEVEEEGTTTPAVLRKYTRARNVESAWRALERAEAQLLRFEDRLGLSPLARMKLGKMAQNKNADLALIYAAEDDGETA